MTEKLRLVTSFGELRAGMIVVVKDCSWCDGGQHRGIILSRYSGPTRKGDGKKDHVVGAWYLSPDPHEDGTGFLVSQDDVFDRAVYRVEDGLEDSNTQTSKRSTKKPKSASPPRELVGRLR